MAVGSPDDVVVTLPRDAVTKATAHFVGQQPLIAPVEAGQQVGRIDIVVDGEVRRSVPVVALEGVPQAGWWGRTVDALTLWWQSLWQR
ncbi:hypothetical protein [Hydrogenophilus thermoluteolus]|uniref:hypothetical protein n=1 Tax=Hydrogenophilus thermoluteolus TaxID=297 RepID=UPI003F66F1EF